MYTVLALPEADKKRSRAGYASKLGYYRNRRSIPLKHRSARINLLENRRRKTKNRAFKRKSHRRRVTSHILDRKFHPLRRIKPQMPLYEFETLLRILPGHQTHRHLGYRFTRDHRL
jgi:hypothetical protein